MSRTIEGTVRQAGPSHSRGSVRNHTVVIDRPVGKGGTDRGPMGGELILLGLAGCFTSTLLAAIAAREAPITDVRVDAQATVEGRPDRITAWTLRVSARGEDPLLLRKLARIAEEGCLAIRSLGQGAQVTVVTELEPSPEPA